MNIISNTCVGAYMMRDVLHQSYENPFCWNIIDAKSMYNLIQSYDSINWLKWKLSADDRWRFSIDIDSKVTVQYVHYHFSPTDHTLRSNGVDLFYDKIWRYIAEKYIERLRRMTSEPIFIIATSYPNDYYSYDEITRICSTSSKYKIIINNNKINLRCDNPNIVFDTTLYDHDNQALAYRLASLLGG